MYSFCKLSEFVKIIPKIVLYSICTQLINFGYSTNKENMKILVCTQFCWYLFSTCSHFIVCTLIVLALFSFHSHLYQNNKGKLNFQFVLIMFVLRLYSICTRLYQSKEFHFCCYNYTCVVLHMYSVILVKRVFINTICTRNVFYT